MKKIVAQQGEVRIDRLVDGIETLPDDVKPFTEKTDKGFIISHSEQGHHHMLVGDDVEVMEKENVPEGMRIFYAILKSPGKMVQDAETPHETIDLPPGVYTFRISREYNPFLEEARRVAD